MSLPEELKHKIELEIEHSNWNGIVDGRKELTDRYRSHHKKLITEDQHRIAYLATRMPATYAVVARVLEEAIKHIPHLSIQSLLDLGAGPGTVLWAAKALFLHLQKCTLVEKDPSLAALGKKFIGSSQEISWHIQDFTTFNFPPHDLVTLSYSIGEIDEKSIPEIIDKCWKATNQALIVIEPGTPVGFERIRSIRSQLISLGAQIGAPCPHALACPMANGDWCHFSERVERSSLHRRIKESSLGYEDEKFSYVVASRMDVDLPSARVLREPMRHSGHVSLVLCTPEGLKQKTYSRKNGEEYRQAKKLEWGSALNNS